MILERGSSGECNTVAVALFSVASATQLLLQCSECCECNTVAVAVFRMLRIMRQHSCSCSVQRCESNTVAVAVFSVADEYYSKIASASAQLGYGISSQSRPPQAD
jgi:hypothetical protein